MLKQVVYASALSQLHQPEVLSDILRESTSHNPSRHITGMLLYINGSFLQVLEGEAEVVEALYKKIAEDPRHTQVVKILELPNVEREFAQWSMGHANLNAGELDQLAGTNDFFSRGHCLTELDRGIVRRVLEEFREGKWRRRIQ